jgi:predicted  nucleic acid-binding Zn-ribbon protein
MSASIFYDPPVVARRVYAGEVRVINDIKFWDKTTKVVHSRIHGEDNNLNIEVKDTDKELNFFTNQITFHDAGGTQLGYIDSEGTIHGLSVDGHATNVDITDLEDDLTDNAARIYTLETDLTDNALRVSTLETDLTDNALRVSTLVTDLTDNALRVSTLETDLTSNSSRVDVLETDLTDNALRVSTLESDLTSNASRVGVLETDLTDNALRVSTLETDLTDKALRVSTLETDLTDNALRVSTLETDLTDNALRVSTLETDLADNTSRIGILESNISYDRVVTVDGVEETVNGNVYTLSVVVDDHASRIDVLETDLTDNASRVTTLETDLADNTSRISILESNISYDRTVTVNGQEQIVNGNVYTLSVVVDDHASRIDDLETDLTDNASRVSTLETDVSSHTGRLELLESNISYEREGDTDVFTGNVYTLSVVVDDHASRISTIESDYVTTNELITATAASAAASAGTSGLISTASTWFTTSSGTSKTVGDWFEELNETYEDDEEFSLKNLVNKPSDWDTYPPSIGANTTLKSYTEQKSAYQADQKVNAFKNGNSSYLKLRDASTNLSGSRIGTQKIEFLRTTANESFGADECADWRITTNSSCGLDIYRKATNSYLGSIYDGNVIEFDADGDVNVVKSGGLLVNGNEVATKAYTDSTYAEISLEQSVSDLSTSVSTLTNDVSGHDTRISTLESSGYITSSALSPYVRTSSLQSNYTTTADLNTSLSNKVDTATLQSQYTSTSALNTSLSNKVDTATLQSNYTTTTDLNTLLAEKVDTSTLSSDYTSSTALAALLAAKLTDVQVGTVATGSPAAVTASKSGTTTTLDFTFPSAGSSYFQAGTGNDIYYTSGNVGIGDVTPSEKLEVGGNIKAGYVYGDYMNMSHNRTDRTDDTVFYSSTDDFIRKNSYTGMRKSLAGSGMLTRSTVQITNSGATDINILWNSTIKHHEKSGSMYKYSNALRFPVTGYYVVTAHCHMYTHVRHWASRVLFRRYSSSGSLYGHSSRGTFYGSGTNTYGTSGNHDIFNLETAVVFANAGDYMTINLQTTGGTNRNYANRWDFISAVLVTTV